MQNEFNMDAGDIRIKVKKTLLEEYFVYELRDLLGAEQQLRVALEDWKKAAVSPELADAIEEHMVHTEQHIKRLEMVFDMMGEPARPKKCEAIDGIIREAAAVLSEADRNSATHDVALVMS